MKKTYLQLFQGTKNLRRYRKNVQFLLLDCGYRALNFQIVKFMGSDKDKVPCEAGRCKITVYYTV